MEESKKLKAIMKLREMVEELMSEDFETNRKPKLMAMKVSVAEPVAKLDMESDDSESESELLESKPGAEMLSEGGESDEICEKCGKMGCDCEEMPESKDNDKVSKLKALLMKK